MSVGHEIQRNISSQYINPFRLPFALRPRVLLVTAKPSVCAHLCTYARAAV